MTLPDLELQPGQTVIVRITNNLTYRITHTGWVLEVVSNHPFVVKPEGVQSVSILGHGVVERDE